MPSSTYWNAGVLPLAFMIIDLMSSLHYMKNSLSGLEKLVVSHYHFKQLAPSYSFWYLPDASFYKIMTIKQIDKLLTWAVFPWDYFLTSLLMFRECIGPMKKVWDLGASKIFNFPSLSFIIYFEYKKKKDQGKSFT